MALSEHLHHAIHHMAEKYRAKHKEDKHKSEHSKAHPGFKKIQSKIEKEGYSKEIAGKILAARTREASSSARKANPRLNRVKG